MSVLIAGGSKQDLLLSDEIDAVAPEWILFEVGKYWKELSIKSGLSEEDLDDVLSLVREQMTILSVGKYSAMLSTAKDISPDIKDAEYLALALKLNCPIWSEDKLLKRQDKVVVLNTKELLSKLGLA